jgi:CubicO group peptidase (beta-lactamase class C family)
MKRIFFYSVLLTAIFVFGAGCSGPGDTKDPGQSTGGNLIEAETVFPDSEWARARPEDLGFDQSVIDEMGENMEKASANGVLIRNGYLVAEWSFAGPPEKKFDTQSVSKSITSFVLGLALDDKLISGLDAPVKQYYPDFSVGPHTDRITFRHLATNTSGIELTRWDHQYNPGITEPGAENHYHNDHWTELARALTYIYKKPLREVLEQQVLKEINAEMEWWKDGKIGGLVETGDGEKVDVNAGYAFTCWSASDLARVGHLYLNGGRWKDSQLLSREYVKESWTEIDAPIYGHRPGMGEPRVMTMVGYGLGWWTMKGSNVWSMSGNGRQFCMVFPKYNIVIAKVNDYRNETQVGGQVFGRLIMQAMGEPVDSLRMRRPR